MQPEYRSTRRRHPGGRALLLAGLVAASAPLLSAQEPPVNKPLPGYYQFFLKTGKMAKLPPEAAREKALEAGKLSFEKLDTPLPDLVLPAQDGRAVSLRKYAGEGNLVLLTIRSWW